MKKTLLMDLLASLLFGCLVAVTVNVIDSSNMWQFYVWADVLRMIAIFPAFFGIILFAFFPEAAYFSGVLWGLISLLYFRLYRQSIFAGRDYYMVWGIPFLMIAFPAIAVMLLAPGAETAMIDACRNNIGCVGQKLEELDSRNQDAMGFCESLSATKLASSPDEPAFTFDVQLAPGTTYRDYCFMLLGKNRLRFIRARSDEGQLEANYERIVKEVCDASGVISGSDQKRQECVEFFEKIKKPDHNYNYWE